MDAPVTDYERTSPPLASRRPRPSPWRFGWTGARVSGYWTSRIILPVAGVLSVLGQIPAVFGLGAGRGFGEHWVALLGIALYLVLVLYVALLGGLIGFGIGLIDWMSGSSTVWAKANRPIRLIPRRWTRRNPDGPKQEPGFGPILRVNPTRRPYRPFWWFPWVAVPGFSLLLGVFAFGIYAGRVVDRKLAAAIADADHDDPNWRIEDLMATLEPIPDDENAAHVVAEVVATLPEGWLSAAPAKPGQQSPPPSAIRQALEQAAVTADNRRLDPATAATIREELAAHADIVAMARPLAAAHRGRHELQIALNPLNTSLPHTQASRDVARLLAADAVNLAEDGDLDAALDSCRGILGVSRSIGDEPFLISGLVRIAIQSVALMTTRRVLAQGEPSDVALARLQTMILEDRADPFFLKEVQGERAALEALIRRIRNAELAIGSLSGGKSDAPVAAISPWGLLMFDNQRALGLKWMNALVDIARQQPSKRPALLKTWSAEYTEVKNEWFAAFTSTLPLLMMPAMDAGSNAHLRSQAELGAMAILLAAERRRRRTGAWPESITAIDPAILGEPPLDPYSDRSYLIDRPDGQFLVHSVGINLRDEHGAYDPKPSIKGGPDDVGFGAWAASLRRWPAQSAVPNP